jgi:hypothetical protein
LQEFLYADDLLFLAIIYLVTLEILRCAQSNKKIILNKNLSQKFYAKSTASQPYKKSSPGLAEAFKGGQIVFCEVSNSMTLDLF